MRPKREHCRESRICKSINNLNKGSHKEAVFFNFSKADEKSYPANDDDATEKGALSSESDIKKQLK